MLCKAGGGIARSVVNLALQCNSEDGDYCSTARLELFVLVKGAIGRGKLQLELNMISGAHTARHREALRGVQQLANHHITRTFLNSDCSGSELDSGISFLGSREASGHSSFVDRKQGSSRHFMSTPSSSDLKTQDRSPFQLDSRRSLKTSSLFKVPSIEPLCKLRVDSAFLLLCRLSNQISMHSQV